MINSGKIINPQVAQRSNYVVYALFVRFVAVLNFYRSKTKGD